MSETFEPGAAFQGYTIVRLIGRGGIGEVYEARHDFLGRRVAIKTLRLVHISASATAAQRATATQRMTKEAQALCALDHPNIIRIYDAGAVGELAYMVCELLEGGTLRDKLEAEGALPILAALRYLAEWTDALVQVHAAGIIHRDLKPENVFITRAGPGKLLDFGAALDSSQRITVKGHTVGTPAYMAPEHLAGDGDIDFRADVYPMGILLFEAVTGRHPFVDPNEPLPDHFEFARRHLFEPWPKVSAFLPSAPRSLDVIVDRCLAKNPDERYPNIQALHDAVKAALAEASAPQAIPLVNKAPLAVQGKTKPMPRQTAMRLDLAMGTMRMGMAPPQKTAAMTPTPPPGAARVPPQPTVDDRALPAAAARTAPMPAGGHVSTVPASSARTSAMPAQGSVAPALPFGAKPAKKSNTGMLVGIAAFLTVTAVVLCGILLRQRAATPTIEAPPTASASAAAPPPPATATAPEPPPPQPPPSGPPAPPEPSIPAAPPETAAPTPSPKIAPPPHAPTTKRPPPPRHTQPPPQPPKREPIF